MRNSVWSLPFDASTDFVARRELAGDNEVSLSPGETVPEGAFSPRRLRQLFDMRHIVHRVTLEALNQGLHRFETNPFAIAVETAEPVAVETFAPLNDAGLPVIPTDIAPVPTLPVLPDAPQEPAPVVASVPELPGLPVLPDAPQEPAPVVVPEPEQNEAPAPVVVPEPEEDDIEKLRAEAKSLDIDFDGRWGVKRLRAAIESKKNENGEPA